MTERSGEETKNELKENRVRVLKLRMLGIGIVLVFISVLISQFFVQLRYPPELKLPIELRPAWTFDESRVKTMQFVGDVGIIIGWIILIIGLIFVVYGFTARILDKRLGVSQRFEKNIWETMIDHLKSDPNFVLLVIGSVVFGIIWIFNLLTYPGTGPLYFLREPYLQ